MWSRTGRPRRRRELRIDVAQRRLLTDLATIHDEAVAGKLAGKTVLIPNPRG